MEEETKNLNQESHSECKTVLLQDLPSDTDAFGSHDRVAGAIAKLVEEDGGKAIALAGSWGSGKSTLVGLLESKLSKPQGEKTTYHRIFNFNVWEHQGDPLRRSFLESLINFLLLKDDIEQLWIEESTWKEELEKIAMRKEDTHTTTEPVLTNPGKIIALSLLILPLGYVLFDTISKENYPSYLWLLGLIIVILPVIIVAITRMISSKGEHSLLGLFIHKIRDITKSTTIRTPDPTSIEFRDIFTRLMNEAIGSADRKLTIVIDNLDRVEPQEALSIWSTMRTFFELDNKTNDEWMKRFWLIVPFDPTGLRRLWHIEGDSTDELVNAFVDKTFQIKFHVAPPVLSDWKDFLFGQLTKAFPNHKQEDDFDKIYSLYRTYRSVEIQNRPPTPRDIKLFINQVGGYHRIWGDYVPLYYQALYVLYKKEIHKNYDAFTKPDFINQKIQNLIEDDFLKWLAVLHFNVKPPEKALQILIESDLENALKSGNVDQLKDLSKIPGFIVVCENTVQENIEEWAKSEPETITSAAYLFEIFSEDTEFNLTKICKHIQKAIQTVTSWRRLDENIGNGLVAILKTSESQEYEEIAGNILLTLSKSEITKTQKDQEPPETLDQNRIQEWVKGTLTVLNAIDQTSRYDLIKKNFKVPGNSKVYIEAIKVLAKDKRKDEFGKYFVPQSDPKNILSELISQCSNGMFTQEYNECIDIMIQINGNWPWINLIAPINQRLQLENSITAPEVVGCLGTITSLAYKKAIPEANTNLEQLSNNGLLMHHLHQAQSVKNIHTVALCIFPLLDFNPAGEIDTPLGNSAVGIDVYNTILRDPSNNKEVVNNLSDLFIKYNKIEDLLNKPIDAPNTKPMVKGILEVIVQRDDAHKYLTLDKTIKHNQILQDSLTDAELSNLIRKLVLEADFLAVLANEHFSAKLADLYLLALENSKDRNQSTFLDFLTGGFGSVEKDEWKIELDTEGKLLQLLLYFVDNKMVLNLSTKYSDALLDHADHVNSGKAKIKHQFNNSTNLLSPLIPASKNIYMVKLRDKIVAISKNEIHRIIEFYGDELINSGLLEQDANNIVMNLFSNILDRQNLQELEWVRKAINQEPEILNKSSGDSKKDFVNRLENTLSKIEVTEDIRPVTEDIAEAFGINPSNFQPEQTSEEELESKDEENQPE